MPEAEQYKPAFEKQIDPEGRHHWSEADVSMPQATAEQVTPAIRRGSAGLPSSARHSDGVFPWPTGQVPVASAPSSPVNVEPAAQAAFGVQRFPSSQESPIRADAAQ